MDSNDGIVNQVGRYAREHRVYVVWCFDYEEPVGVISTEVTASFIAGAHRVERHHDTI